MSSSATDQINRQIETEFRKLNDFMTLSSEKPEILARISKLTAMLPNQQQTPSRQEIVAEVCEQIIQEARKTSGRTLREICDTIVANA